MAKKISAVFLFLLLWIGVFFLRSTLETEEIAAGEQGLQGTENWDPLIAEYVNEQGVSVVVSGTAVSFSDDLPYMSSGLEVMLPLDMFQSSFQCAVNVYHGTDILIEQGSTTIELTVGRSEYKLNNATLPLADPVVKKQDTIYVPMIVAKTSLGYTSSWNIVETTVSLESTVESIQILPVYYNYADMEKIGEAKNQGTNGNCWAFAALTALETTLLPEESYSFSADHLTLRPSFLNANGNGGNYTMALAYLLSWEGPVRESEDPYDDERNDKAEEAVHLQEAQVIPSKDYETIKMMVYQYGGVQSSMYMSLTGADSESRYYDEETASYAYIGTEKPNHDIVIIGWDDNYPAGNFSVDVGGDGAFICRNSWGSEFGDEGNFYVSYYDTNIGVHNIVYTVVEGVDNYDHIYQSDLCGWTGNMGYNSETAYMANIFTAQSDQILEAVGFYATGMYTQYSVYVVRDYSGTGDLKHRFKVAEGRFLNSGYYTVPLDSEIAIEGGSNFAVIVRIVTPDSDMPIAIEYLSEDSNLLIDVSDGRGYISSNGDYWENTEGSREVNVCLKAYTSDSR